MQLHKLLLAGRVMDALDELNANFPLKNPYRVSCLGLHVQLCSSLLSSFSLVFKSQSLCIRNFFDSSSRHRGGTRRVFPVQVPQCSHQGLGIKILVLGSAVRARL